MPASSQRLRARQRFETTAEGGISIQPGPMTLVGCPADSQADAYLAGLLGATSYTVKRGTQSGTYLTTIPLGDVTMQPMPTPRRSGLLPASKRSAASNASSAGASARSIRTKRPASTAQS